MAVGFHCGDVIGMFLSFLFLMLRHSVDVKGEAAKSFRQRARGGGNARKKCRRSASVGEELARMEEHFSWLNSIILSSIHQVLLPGLNFFVFVFPQSESD